MKLLAAWLEITAGWRDVFSQERTAVRAIRTANISLDNARARKVLKTPMCGIEAAVERIAALRQA